MKTALDLVKFNRASLAATKALRAAMKNRNKKLLSAESVRERLLRCLRLNPNIIQPA